MYLQVYSLLSSSNSFGSVQSVSAVVAAAVSLALEQAGNLL